MTTFQNTKSFGYFIESMSYNRYTCTVTDAEACGSLHTMDLYFLMLILYNKISDDSNIEIHEVGVSL